MILRFLLCQTVYTTLRPMLSQRLLFGTEARLFSGEAVMLKFLRFISRLQKSEDGPTTVEYAVMLALIVVICLASIRRIGTRSNTTFRRVAQSISAS